MPVWKSAEHPDGHVTGRGLAQKLGVSPAAITKWFKAGDIRPRYKGIKGKGQVYYLYHLEECRGIAMAAHPEAFAGGGHGGKRENSGRLNDDRDGVQIEGTKGRRDGGTEGKAGKTQESGPRTKDPGPRTKDASPARAARLAERDAVEHALEQTFGASGDPEFHDPDAGAEEGASGEGGGEGAGSVGEDGLTLDQRKAEWEEQRRQQKTLTEARVRETLLDIHKKELALFEQKKLLVAAAPLVDATGRHLRAVRQAIDNLPRRGGPTMAAALKLDEAGAAIARRVLEDLTRSLCDLLASQPFGQPQDAPA